MDTLHRHNLRNPKSVFSEPKILRLPITYCCNKKHNRKDFHKLSGKSSNFKPIYRSKSDLHILVSTTAECSDELNKNKRNYVQKFMDLASRQRDMLSSGWLPKMGRSYGSDLMVVLGLGYWVQGFRIFPWWALNFYLKDNLRLGPGTMQFLQNTVNLPMVAKPIYGIFSDAVYIGGAHRLPYICIGGLLQAISWGSIAFIPAGDSSIAIMTAFLLLSNLGASVVEVATDGLVAECGKRNKGISSGELQSFAWMALATGSVLGNLFGGIIVSQVDAKTMFIIFLLPLSIQVGTSLIFREESFGLYSIRQTKVAQYPSPIKGKSQGAPSFHKSITGASMNNIIGLEWRKRSIMRSIRNQISDIVRVIRRPEIAYPVAWFAASIGMTPLLTGTMFFYHTQHLKINPHILALAKVVGQISLLLGSFIYNRFLKKVPLRKLVAGVQILLSLFMLADIFLVKQINIQLGIPNEAYVIGASASVEAIAQFKLLPFTVLLAQLCPTGCEGSVMALFMSVQCLASIVSGYSGAALASFLGVSSGDYSRLPLAIFIQSIATLVPLTWISFIPGTKPAIECHKRSSKVL